jgi:pimeloyl-ACP methyl ester carboxylesterase
MVKIVKVSGSLLLVILAAMLISYFVFQMQLDEITPEIRMRGGDFIALPDGIISYSWKGPQTGEVVVFIHGFSTPKFVFNHNADAMASAGFRVLAFDHFGRGYSDRPDAVYDKDFFDRELLHLLDALKIKKPVHVVGYSMGGGIAAVFAGRHPERVQKLALIAPVGFMPEYSGGEALLLIPGVGEWLMSMVGKTSMIATFQEEVDHRVATPVMLDLFKRQFRYKGWSSALLSTMRNFPMSGLQEDFEKVGKLDMPKLLIWGTKDTAVPFVGANGVLKAISDIKFVPVPHAGHSIVYSHAKVVNRILMNFLDDKTETI